MTIGDNATTKLIRALLADCVESVVLVGPDGTILLDGTPDGRLLGHAGEELAGANLASFLHPDEAAEHLAALALALATPGATAHRTARARHVDGSWRVLEVTVRHVEGGPGLNGAVLTCRDITERLEAEDALRAHESQLQRVLRAVPAVVFRCRAMADGRVGFDYVSERARELLGTSPEGILASADAAFAVLDAVDAARARELVEAALGQRPLGPPPHVLEARLAAPGLPRWVRLTVEPEHLQSDGVPRAAGLWLDVTADHRARDEHARLETQVRQAHTADSLATLAAGVAHDLNNLLVGVRANVGALLDGTDPSHAHRATLSDVDQAAAQIARVTQQLMIFAGRGEPRLQVVNLEHVTRDALPLLRSSAGAECVVRLEEGNAPQAVEADAGQLLQALLNLVINAAEAGARCVRLGVDAHVLRAHELPALAVAGGLGPGRHACLWVEDDGGGMEQGTLARAFEPFFSSKADGRGLGLAVVAGVVRSHQGGLRVRSTPGSGTRFELFLPRAARPPDPVAASRPALALPPDRRALLVLDDEPYVRQAMIRTLGRLGLRAILAETFVEAVDLLGAHGAEILAALVDAALPDMPGEPAALFKQLCPGLPVLACSGLSEREARARLGGAVDGYLSKPFTLEEMHAALSRVLARD